MRILRVQVEDGFLNDLNLELKPGLNVIIGPRGAGKTSVIELIRFCLGAPTLTEKAAEAARQHALSVLGSGQVTVTLDMDGVEVLVSRTADEDAPRATGPFRTPTLLAQDEMEAIGLSALSRLKLVDEFISESDQVRTDFRAARAELRAVTSEIDNIGADVEALAEQLSAADSIAAELAVAETKAQKALADAQATEVQRSELDRLQSQSAALAARSQVIKGATDSLSQWASELDRLVERRPRLAAWPPIAGTHDLLAEDRTLIERESAKLTGTVQAVRQAIQNTGDLSREAESEALAVDARARALRGSLEATQQGLGALTNNVTTLRQRTAQFAALRSLQAEAEARLRNAIDRRAVLFDGMEKLETQRLHGRRNVADHLNQLLGPGIEVVIDKAALGGAYTEAISVALKGSGLHYNSLAPTIAKAVSPRELAEIVTRQDAQTLATAAQLPLDRAARIIGELRSSGIETIVAAPIEDGVSLALLDGAEYKSTSQLSTGQRCTVVLPIVLAHKGRPLIADQPEDHLDNAFIAETLIKAIQARKLTDQLLFATHNANIPVLGGADEVIVMASDGKRGFVRHHGALDDTATVKAIATLMEGGIEAFRQRAAFYSAL